MKPNPEYENAKFTVLSLARLIYKDTSRNRRYIQKLRRIGASNYEIANALGIKETDPVLQE